MPVKTPFAILILLGGALTAYLVLREGHAEGVSGQAFLMPNQTETRTGSTPVPLGGAHFLVMWRGQVLDNFVDGSSVCLRAHLTTTDSNGEFSAPAWVAPQRWPLVTDIQASVYPFDFRYVAATNRPDRVPAGVKSSTVVYLRRRDPESADSAMQVIQNEQTRCERHD